MKKNIITFLILLMSTNLGCSFQKTSQAKINLPTENFVKIIRKLEIKSCKKIENTPCRPSEFYSSASGMALGSLTKDGGSVVLTAGHICDSGISDNVLNLIEQYQVEISVISTTGEEYKSSVLLSTDMSKTKRDLCLLQVADLKSKTIKISKKDPQKGDTLYNVAAPRGVFHPPTVPIFIGIFSGQIDSSNVMTTIPAAGGSSGSAVFNQKGELVGVIFAAVPEFPNISLASSRISTVSFILEGIKILKGEAKK